MAKKTRKPLEPVSTRPGVMYGSSKVHKTSVENFPPFGPILSALNTPTYKLVKFLVPILKPLTTNEFTFKDTFHFAEEIVDQQHDFFMGSFDVDSLFTNMPLQETVDICTNELFKESETVEGLNKIEFKGIVLCRAEIFPCNRFSPPRQDKKVNYRRFFYCVFTTHATSICEKKS